jgi:octaheme c-type cytochrome (tetrathionate reductase family)
MRTQALAALALAFLIPAASAAVAPATKPPSQTVDHSKFEPLQRAFASGPEVTKACLSCHKEASRQVHKTQHWLWEYVNPDTGQKLGKRHVVNNFCTSTATNLAACASCHIGYGLKDAKFDFASQENVDCVVCHDTTGKYKKPGGLAGNVVTKDMELPTGSGKIVKALDLAAIAQRVGKTSRATCGTCHFYGGGGDGVKHGDMDSSLEAPERSLDVHMDAKGLNFTCTTCHQTENHAVPGSRYGPMGATFGCDSCHGAKPHKANVRLDAHTEKIACQACHIPRFARGGVPTKMVWDWSTAGQRGSDGKPLVRKNAEGYDIYNGTKGDFTLAQDVTPDYAWFNGKIRYTLQADRIDANDGPVAINRFEGSATDGRSKIWPVKVFRAKQAWDPVNKVLAVTHLAGNDDTAYWKHLDWKKAVATGMAAVNAPFSGEVGFIETVSTWPITHMVAPKADALACADCHTANGRLAKVPGVSPANLKIGKSR